MDYHQLEALVALMQYGTYTKASQALHITQSALSQRIQALEENMGAPLVLRGTPIAVTEIGQRLINHFHTVKILERELVGQIHGDGAKSGPLRVPVAANFDSLATWFFKALAPEFTDGHSTLEVYGSDQSQTDEFLRKGTVIGAVTDKKKPAYGCVSEPLGEMTYQLFCSPEFYRKHFYAGVTKETIIAAPIVIFGVEDKLLHDFYRDQFRATSDWKPITHVVPTSSGLVSAVKAGLAMTLLPTIMVQSEIESGSLLVIAPQRKLRLPLYWHVNQSLASSLSELTKSLLLGAKRFLK